jgi:hypothetical protein
MAGIFESRKHRLNNSIKALNLKSILVAPLSVNPKYHCMEHGKTTAMKEQQI